MARYGISSPADVVTALDACDYLADEGLATTVFLALGLERPLLLEGDAGVGKTEIAKSIAAWLHTSLIRLQCFEGIDMAQALYEWNYSRQLLHLRAVESLDHGDGSRSIRDVEAELYSKDFLLERPLLAAIDQSQRGASDMPPVLLIDEIDRADDEFEAFLLEILSEFAVTIPELGTIRASTPPIVILTSNRTRDLHDALKRRCLYHWVNHPGFDREVQILRRRAPEVDESLARQVASVVSRIRDADLYKPPGIAETIDWARSLALLGETELDERSVSRTLGALVKYREDEERLRALDLASIIRDTVTRSV
ncbi:MAG: AAA family ATPase [Acidimicrobiales bacterium]